jgi:hypothetical protein
VRNAVLDRRAQLYIYADKQAKGYLQAAAAQAENRSYRIYGEPWSLCIREGKTVRIAFKSIQEHIDGTSKRILQYWAKKGKFENGEAIDVDWDAVHHAARNSTQSRRTWISNQSSGHFYE